MDRSSSEASGVLAGRVALVTGASRGIGREVAKRFAAAGAKLFLVARGEAALEAVAAEVGGGPLRADVGDAEEVARLAAAVMDRLDGGVPDILVNAAGAFRLSPLAEMEIADFDHLIAVNLRGPFLLIRAFLPGMLERGSGHIVTIGSIAGRQTFPHNGAYSASKFGVRGMHVVMDAVLGVTVVRVSLVECSASVMELWDVIDFDRHPGLPPRAAMLRPEEVAVAIVYAVTRPSEMDVRTIILDRT